MNDRIKEIMLNRAQELVVFSVNDSVTRENWKTNVDCDIKKLNFKNDYKIICDESNNKSFGSVFVGQVLYKNEDESFTVLTCEVKPDIKLNETTYKGM